eukprot:TRINITY_DN71467_c0_g1_i2.p1 TRINITY_DN71467_c0_g1~~TRINITY_DN71467_c0_g1_i2.p1  ORF type:complete len:110 (-),score=4.28 TRINITY_DN71467_c0_g1_i2:76-405(-)
MTARKRSKTQLDDLPLAKLCRINGLTGVVCEVQSGITIAEAKREIHRQRGIRIEAQTLLHARQRLTNRQRVKYTELTLVQTMPYVGIHVCCDSISGKLDACVPQSLRHF